MPYGVNARPMLPVTPLTENSIFDGCAFPWFSKSSNFNPRYATSNCKLTDGVSGTDVWAAMRNPYAGLKRVFEYVVFPVVAVKEPFSEIYPKA